MTKLKSAKIAKMSSLSNRKISISTKKSMYRRRRGVPSAGKCGVIRGAMNAIYTEGIAICAENQP
jgi:hypothetical protein